MPRQFPRRGRRNQNIIQSVKNSGETRQTLIPATSADIVLAGGTEVGVATKILGTEVPVGAKVFSIELWINAVPTVGTDTSEGDWYIAKNREGQTLGSFPDPDFSTTGLSEKRNQIFHQEAFQTGTEDAGPYKFHRRLKIPRIYQRMRAGDFIFVKIEADLALTTQVAFLYKYYQ